MDTHNGKVESNKIMVWFMSPMIHYPLWFLLMWRLIDFITGSNDIEALIISSTICVITGLWGLITRMCFFRIPFLSSWLDENGFIWVANVFLICIGLLLAIVTKMLNEDVSISSILMEFLVDL